MQSCRSSIDSSVFPGNLQRACARARQKFAFVTKIEQPADVGSKRESYRELQAPRVEERGAIKNWVSRETASRRIVDALRAMNLARNDERSLGIGRNPRLNAIILGYGAETNNCNVKGAPGRAISAQSFICTYRKIKRGGE